MKSDIGNKKAVHRVVWQRVMCFLWRHPWRVCMDNLHGINERMPVTICWKECPACGKSRLIFIFGNGHSQNLTTDHRPRDARREDDAR